jgi:protein OS-9
MKKLGIMDPADVEKFKANIQRVAGRKAWKLDLVDTPRGREFRGIIETEDADELDGKAKGDTKAKTKGKSDSKAKGKGMGDTKPLDTPKTGGSSSDSDSDSVRTSKEQQASADDDEEEAYAGTEEEYKDEL